jgi:hypothetical protein
VPTATDFLGRPVDWIEADPDAADHWDTRQWHRL